MTDKEDILKENLLKHFGHLNFKSSLQYQAVECVLEGNIYTQSTLFLLVFFSLGLKGREMSLFPCQQVLGNPSVISSLLSCQMG